MREPIRILLIEDNPDDAELIQRLLVKEMPGCSLHIVTNRKEFLDSMTRENPDVILSDNSLPQLSALDALQLVRKGSDEVPFIMVTGTVSEEYAVDIIKNGADDYVIKDRLARLPSAIDSSLKYRDAERAKKEAAAKLGKSEETLRMMMERLSDGFIAFDKDWNYTYVNKKAGEITKRLPSELIGKNTWAEYPQKIGQVFYNALHEAMATQQYMHLEEYSPAHNIWMENHVYPSPDGVSIFFRDISERKIAEQKINESQLNLEAIFDNTSEGFMLTDKEGVIKMFNGRAGDSLLFNQTGVIAKGGSIFDLVEDNRKLFFKEVFLRVAAGEQFQYDRCFEVPSGNKTWVNFNFNPVREGGAITGVCITGRDITDRKNAEQEKEFQQSNLYALINNTHDMMWSVDRQFRLITSNDTFNKLLLRLTGELPKAGDRILSVSTDVDQTKRFSNYYQRAFEGEAFSIEEHSLKPYETWSEISFYPIYEEKKVVGTACFSRNITRQRKADDEIKKSNERFELAASATNDVIWDWNIESGRVWLSDKFYAHFDYPKTEAIHGPAYLHGHLHPEDRERVVAGIAKAFQRRRAYWTDEYRCLKADGKVLYILDCGYILYHETGHAYRMVGAMLDITDRRKSEAELKKSYAEKQELAGRMAAILNTLPAHIALLDRSGVIVDVNDAWGSADERNGFLGNNYGVGDNYLLLSEVGSGGEETDLEAVKAGIGGVLNNRIPVFEFEYVDHSSDLKRWFRMIVSPLVEKEYTGAVVMHIDISELRKLEEERLASKEEEQKKVTEAMLEGQEKERNAIGIELHDNVNQILIGTNMILALIGQSPEKLPELLPECILNIRSAVSENRKIAHELVTPFFAIESLSEQLARLSVMMLQSNGIQTEIHDEDFDEQVLNGDQKLAIYRIAQEQCTNIVKYASAHHVIFQLYTTGDQFSMKISDNGVGMNLSEVASGIGLKNIASRIHVLKGSLLINTAPGKGFEIEVDLPLTV